jgi:hypothetical protein
VVVREPDDEVDERTMASWPGEAQEGRAGDQGAEPDLEKGSHAAFGDAADVARSQMPEDDTQAQRETSQAGADSTAGLASRKVDPLREEREVEG